MQRMCAHIYEKHIETAHAFVQTHTQVPTFMVSKTQQQQTAPKSATKTRQRSTQLRRRYPHPALTEFVLCRLLHYFVTTLREFHTTNLLQYIQHSVTCLRAWPWRGMVKKQSHALPKKKTSSGENELNWTGPGHGVASDVVKVGLGISRTNADSQWNPVYNAFHRIFCCGNETIRR